MAENTSKSKLKRKKSTVEGISPGICSRVQQKKSQTTASSREMTAEPGRSVVPAAVWWDSEQLPAVEALWALTMKSALQNLQNQHWDRVPDLPEPSKMRPSAKMEDEQRWGGLGEVVPPFPEPPPPPQTSARPGPPSTSAAKEDLPLQNKPAADPPKPQHCSQGRKSVNVKKTSLQSVTERPAGVGGAEGEQGGRRGLQNLLRVSDRGVPQEEEAGWKEVVENKKEEEEEVQRRVREDGGGGVLQSCPMCLLVFPVGFTQMDCDGHLAQCLSEVNMDVTW